MPTLEELFQEEILPNEMAYKLVYSFGTLSEFRRLTGVPIEYPFLDEGYILLPDARGSTNSLAESFYKFCNRAWDSFIRVADRKAEVGGELEKEKKRLKEKGGNFLVEWPSLEVKLLEEEIYYVINKIKEEQSFGYQDPCQPMSFFNRVDSIAEIAKKTESQSQINFFWAALGSYLSDLFDKYMNEKRADGSIDCSSYNRDIIFRHHIIKPILESLFNSVSDKIGSTSKTEFFLKGLDISIVDKRITGIDKEAIIGKLLLYPEVLKPKGISRINANEYRIIRRQLLNYVSRLCSTDGSLDAIFQNVGDIAKVVKNLKERREINRLIERLIYNPTMIDYISKESSAVRELVNQGIESVEVTFGKFKELVQILQQQDWLTNIIYSSIIDISKTQFKGKEEELYNKKKLADFTGKRPMFQEGIIGLVWGTDLVNSEKFREYFKTIGMTDEEAEASLHNIHYQFMLQNPKEKKDDSIFWKHAFKSDAKTMPHLYGGDGRVVLLEGDWLMLRWLLAVKNYYEEQQSIQDPEFVKRSGQDINYRSGVVFGYIPDKFASSEVIGVAKLLYTNGKEYQESGIEYKTLENKLCNIKNEFVLFASGSGEKGAIIYNLLDKLKCELSTLQEYVNKKDENSLKKLPQEIRNAINKANKELEERKTKREVDASTSLNVLLTEYVLKTIRNGAENGKYSPWLAFKTYRTELVKAPIIYLGTYAGKRPWKFDIYAVLPTNAHIDKFVKWYREMPK